MRCRPVFLVFAAYALLSPLPSRADGRLTTATLNHVTAGIAHAGAWRCSLDGGELAAGLVLGWWLRQRTAAVEIRPGDRCGSAAALAAMGAPRLFKAAQGRLVFHGPDRPLASSDRAGLLRTLTVWNVPPAIATRIAGLQIGETWEIDGSDLAALLASRLR